MQEKKLRKQYAVLWMATGAVDDYAQVKVSAAVEIRVRWEQTKRESLNPKGDTVAIDATAWVDRSVVDGSILWLGKLKDLSSPPSGLMQSINYTEIPDIKGHAPERTIQLMRYSNTLPAVV